MINYKKDIVCIFVLMIVISLCNGCQSSTKPSEKEMRDIIIKIESSMIGKDKISNISLDKFELINGFCSIAKIGSAECNLYCINVNYILAYTPTSSSNRKEFIREKVKYSFYIIDNRWYGNVGWVVIQ
jgi:hypothetical protein